jgi:hypothetical protein
MPRPRQLYGIPVSQAKSLYTPLSYPTRAVNLFQFIFIHWYGNLYEVDNIIVKYWMHRTDRILLMSIDLWHPTRKLIELIFTLFFQNVTRLVQAGSLWPLTQKYRVHCQTSPCEIGGVKSATKYYFIFPFQYHYTNAPYSHAVSVPQTLHNPSN